MTDLLSLDGLMTEVLSFRLYKKGKKPLGGIDPRSRIKKRIWRDEGVDLDVLANGRIPDEASDLLEMTEIEVKRGIFRKARKHRIAVDLRSLEGLVEADPFEDEKNSHRLKSYVRSDLLFPLSLISTSNALDIIRGSIEVPAVRQSGSPDLSPHTLLVSHGGSIVTVHTGEDLTKLFNKRFPKDKWLGTSSGKRIKGLPSLISCVMDMGNDELLELISEGKLTDFCREVLRSPRLEALFMEVSENGPGGEALQISADDIRSRVLRWIMESEIADQVHREIIKSELKRLLTCSKREASRMERNLENTMDTRSTGILRDLIFDVPPENRGAVIGLLGATGDRSAVEPLERLESFSSVEEDRTEARRALRRLGARSEDGRRG